MIKTDIINQVAKVADITRVKAVVAVEAVPRSPPFYGRSTRAPGLWCTRPSSL